MNVIKNPVRLKNTRVVFKHKYTKHIEMKFTWMIFITREHMYISVHFYNNN